MFFDLGGHVGVGAHRARKLANSKLVARVLQAPAVASHLGDEHRQLVAKRGRLGMHPVRAADRQRVLVADRELGQDRFQGLEVLGEDVRRLLDLQRQRRVQHVRRGQPQVDPASGGPESFGDRSGEGNHVVVGLTEELGRAFGLNRRAADRSHVVLRNRTHVRPGLAYRQLNLEPQLGAVLVGPHPAHARPGIARDHPTVATARGTSAPISRRNCFPSNWMASAAA